MYFKPSGSQAPQAESRIVEPAHFEQEPLYERTKNHSNWDCYLYGTVILYLATSAVISGMVFWKQNYHLDKPSEDQGILDNLVFNLKQVPIMELEVKINDVTRRESTLSNHYTHDTQNQACSTGFEE
jgi:hypothetical protein